MRMTVGRTAAATPWTARGQAVATTQRDFRARLAGETLLPRSIFQNEAKLEIRIQRFMKMLRKMQDGSGRRKRTQIGLRMASFPAEMGLFWGVFEGGGRTRRPRTRHAGRQRTACSSIPDHLIQTMHARLDTQDAIYNSHVDSQVSCVVMSVCENENRSGHHS